MASEWITGLFGVGGVALGVLVEPVKNRFARQMRARQVRAERIERFVTQGAALGDAVADYNRVVRAIEAGTARSDAKQFKSRMVSRINSARADMRDALALFRLYGPDELAAEANVVMEAAREVMVLIDEPSDGSSDGVELPVKLTDGVELPVKLQVAAERFQESLIQFSTSEARSSAR